MFLPVEKIFQNEQQKAFLTRLVRKIFLEDWLIKLVALLITLALWFGVTGLRAPITTRLNSVTLQPRLPSDLEITNSPVTEVSLVISGDSRKIDQIRAENLIVSFDLTDVPPGERIIQLTPETINVELPTGVKLDEIQPNKIAVKLENVEEREINVRAETEGALAEGFEIYNQTISPQRVRVRGPSSFIKSLDFVSTEKINLDNQREDFTARQVSLNVVNPKAAVLDAVVDVTFRVGEKRIERLFLIPVETENGTKNASVILFGARSLLEGIKPEELQVQLTKNESGETSPRLILPVEIEEKVEIKKLKLN